MRILLVEDNDDLREQMADVIRLTGEHAIAVAKDGEEGLRSLRDEDFDLVVTDIGLPKSSGLEMLDDAQRQGLLAQTEVVICSAERGLRSEADLRGASWLRKPVDVDKLCALVHAARARVAAREDSLLVDSGVELAPTPGGRK